MRSCFILWAAVIAAAAVERLQAQACSYTVSPGSVNAAAPVGGVGTSTITITPTGTIDFVFTLRTTAGGVFSLSPTQVLAAQKPFQIVLTTKPRQVTTYDPNISIKATRSGSNTSCSGPSGITGSVDGRPNDFALSTLSVDFGEVAVGRTIDAKVTLTPVLPFLGIDVDTSAAPAVKPVGSVPLALPAPTDVTLRFSPTAPGLFGGTVFFSAENTIISHAVQVEGTAVLQTIIPHSAFGGGFLSSLFLTNLASTSNQVTLTRLNQDGSVFDTAPLTLASRATTVISDPANQRNAPLTVKWDNITSSNPIAASILFDARGATSSTAVGALAATPLPGFTVPIQFGGGFTAGIAIVNLDAAPNTVTMRLIGQDGVARATDTLQLTASQQAAFPLTDRAPFRSFLCPGGSCQNFTGSLQVASGNSSQLIAGIVVGSQDGQLFSLPVSPAPAPLVAQLLSGPVPPATFQTVIPHSASGQGFISRLFVTNLADSTNVATVYRFSQTASQISATPLMLAPRATVVIADPESRRNDPQLNVNWFAIDSTAPLTASVLFDLLAAGNRNPVGALASPPLTNFTVPIRLDTGANTGVAILNLSSGSNSVNLRLLSDSGAQQAQDTVVLSALNQTTFVVTDRAPFRQVLCPGGACQSFTGSLVVTSSPSQSVAAMVVGTANGQIFSLPVVQGP